MGTRSCGCIIISSVFLLVFCSSHGASLRGDISKKSSNTAEKLVLSIALGITTGLTSAVLFAFLLRFFVGQMERISVLKGAVIFSPKIAPNALDSALADVAEAELLGSNPTGKYYKISIDGGHTAAVKMILVPYESSPSFRRRVQEELGSLGRLKHPNLMNLQAYVMEPDRLSLVYEYLPNGSLENAIDGVRRSEFRLDWKARLGIAIGIAKGLQHLHFDSAPRVLHRNLKPGNVLLDADLEPKLTDIGVPGMIMMLPCSDRARSAYVAPELFESFRYTEKSDVFSFGVILCVLLSGRDAEDPLFGEIEEVLDRGILDDEEEKDEMLMAVKIAVLCMSEIPDDRPCSDELVSMLTRLSSF